MNRKFYLLIVVSIMVIVGALALVLLLSRNTSNTTGTVDGTASITVDNKIDSPKTYTVEVNEDGVSLLTVLQTLESKDDSFSLGFMTDPTLGAYITSINGYQPDVTKNEFWKIVINDQDSAVGLSDIKPNNGDRIVLEIDNY